MANDIFGDDTLAQSSPDESGNLFGDDVPNGEIEEVEVAFDGQEDAQERSDGPEEGQPAPDQEELQQEESQPDGLILGKFKDTEALANGYINLMAKLGREPGQFDSVEQLAEAYKGAEKELGKPKGNHPQVVEPAATGPAVQPGGANVQQLYSALAQAQQQNQQLQQAVQYLYAQQQQMAQQPNVQQPAKQTDATPAKERNPQEIMEEFYANPSEVIGREARKQLESLIPGIAKELDAKLQPLVQQISPLAQDHYVRSMESNWRKQADSTIARLPDFQDLREDMAREWANDPSLLQTALQHPQGVSFVIRDVYNRAKAQKLQRLEVERQTAAIGQQQQVLRQQNVAQKQAAKLVTGSGAAARVLRQPSPEHQEIEDLFNPGKRQGIFG
jgi:hypothetical protein